MAVLHFQWSGNGIARMTMALERLESSRRHAAFRRALNHTGDKTFTQVKRTLSKQMGLTQKALMGNGRNLKKRRAAGGALDYQIISHGGAIRLKEFKHRVTSKGLTAYPWGVRHSFKSAFVIPRYGGNLYRRRTSKRFPLEALYGPNISKELVKDATAAAFQAIVATELPPRVEHEVRVITSGVLS